VPMGAGPVLRRSASWDLALFTCFDARSTALTPRGGDNAYYAALVNNRLNRRGDDGIVVCKCNGPPPCGSLPPDLMLPIVSLTEH
jgi:hypothetical protein